MTSPLSRTRSRMSIRFVLPEIEGTRSIRFSGIQVLEHCPEKWATARKIR
jgi:hypothetical protein